MTLYSIAVFIIRFGCIGWFLDTIEDVTYLVEYIENVTGPASASYLHLQERGMEMLLARMIFNILVGIAHLVFARPLARLFLRGLTETTKPFAPTEIWPPPPAVPK